ncbi:MAG: rRNA maturation RNase YbeY [Desulfomonile sp.]|nr:rRNA maturation RNase YbeY [Desulfomonile sp.]
MEIFLDNRQSAIEIESSGLTKITERLLEGLGCSASTVLSISLVNAEEMAQLNATYRGKQGPTNVLSFSQHEGGEGAPNLDLLGDVVICADLAAADAEKLGYTNMEMLVYLLTHGVLHLLGHEHDRPEDSEAMKNRVDELFERLLPLLA